MSGSFRFAPHSFASVVYKGGRDKGVELRLRLYKRIERDAHAVAQSLKLGVGLDVMWPLTMCVVLFYFYHLGLSKW